MKIKWKHDTELSVVDSFNEEEDYTYTSNVSIKKGEIDDIDIISLDNDCMNIQFGNGSAALGVPKHFFEIIEE